MQKVINHSKRFFITLYQGFIGQQCLMRAAALSFTTLLGLVPLMVVSLTVLSAFPHFKNTGQQIQQFIFTHFVPTSSEVIQAHLQLFVTQARRLSIVGLCGLIISAIFMMVAIEQAINAIWGVKPKYQGIYAFLKYWAILTITPIFIGASIVVMTYLGSKPWISSFAHHWKLETLLVFLPILLAIIVFTLLFIFTPNSKVRFFHAFISSLLTTALFEIARSLFTLFMVTYPTYQIIYGALAIIPLFLVWIFFSWVIILFGAAVCHALDYKD